MGDHHGQEQEADFTGFGEAGGEFRSSELQAFEALRRRGVGMTFADLISWESHERYLQQLTSHLRSEPPPNYLRPMLPQILKADRQVFLYLIRVRVCVDLKRQPENILLLDSMIFTALQSYEVGFHVLPLPKVGSKDQGSNHFRPRFNTGQERQMCFWRDRPS